MADDSSTAADALAQYQAGTLDIDAIANLSTEVRPPRAPAFAPPLPELGVVRAQSESDLALRRRQHDELEAKRRVLQLERELRAARGRGAARRVEERNRQVGESIRAAMKNTELARVLRGASPLS